MTHHKHAEVIEHQEPHERGTDVSRRAKVEPDARVEVRAEESWLLLLLLWLLLIGIAHRSSLALVLAGVVRGVHHSDAYERDLLTHTFRALAGPRVRQADAIEEYMDASMGAREVVGCLESFAGVDKVTNICDRRSHVSNNYIHSVTLHECWFNLVFSTSAFCCIMQ